MKYKYMKTKGQALVEAIIILPIILLIFFLFISVGIFIFNKTVIQFASNKALDKAVGLYSSQAFTEEEENQIKAAAANAYDVRVFASDPQVDVSISDSITDTESTITVKVTSTFNCDIPFIGDMFKDKKDLVAEHSYICKRK